ncbi:MAG: 2-oxo acid dehydrogenase subunit E2 [Desulfuromonadales bacterium]|nr:2-oxo acid dehydrogenase subunit E2 [Desulfuromonadales bacterium]
MTQEIRLPAVSEGVSEGVVVGIVVAVGDRVDVDQTVLELETDKAALKVFPRFTSSLDQANRELILKRYLRIGVAIDTDDGLLVPVLRDADTKGVERLAIELNEIAGRTAPAN